MRFRSPTQRAAVLLVLTAAPTLAQGVAPGRVVDEGSFNITSPGAGPRTESFRIVRGENDYLVATGQLNDGMRRITSSLTADSLGTPIRYDLYVRENHQQLLHVVAASRAGRLSLMSQDQHGNESMKEYPASAGTCLILENELLHQTYFAALSRRSGTVRVINPQESLGGMYTLTPHGLEPVQVAGTTVTGTHYTLAGPSGRREFWVDASGRLLKVEIPGKGIVAVRDELPQ